MGPVVLAHVYELLGFGRTAESGFAYRPGLSHKSDHRAVGGLPGIHVQDPDTFYGSNGRYNGLDDTLISSLAIVGNTFDELFHGLSFNVTLKVAINPLMAKGMFF
jgi:hypothetical protein